MAVHIHSFFYAFVEALNELRIYLQEVTALLCRQARVEDAYHQLVVTCRRIFAHRAPRRAVGSHRSLVRMIASKLPRRPAKRCNLLLVDEWKNALDKCRTETFKMRAPQCLGIHVGDSRECYIKNGPTSSNALVMDCDIPSNFTQGFSPGNYRRPHMSTSIHECCLRSGCTTFLKDLCLLDDQQLRCLEEELARLRHTRNQFGSSNTAGANVGTPAMERRPLSIHVIPPPPPLPPQPTFVPRNEAQICNGHPEDSIKKQKLHPETFLLGPNLAELLKDFQTVKLRQIEKSPGGTPLRTKLKLADPNDPVSIIALALKKRFSSLQVLEESCEDIEDAAADDTWNSANSMF